LLTLLIFKKGQTHEKVCEIITLNKFLNHPFISDDITNRGGSRCKIGFSDLEDSIKTRRQNGQCIVKFRTVFIKKIHICKHGILIVAIKRKY
jgi:hypothetical protein